MINKKQIKLFSIVIQNLKRMILEEVKSLIFCNNTNEGVFLMHCVKCNVNTKHKINKSGIMA